MRGGFFFVFKWVDSPLHSGMLESCKTLFEKTFNQAPDLLSRAPGRIEFIGNHTDYNGGEVLGVAVNHGIVVALGFRDDRKIRGIIWDDGLFESSLDELVDKPGVGHWSAYPLGVCWAMMEHGMQVKRGFDFAVWSDLPAGAGMSSSAALELATAFALASDLETEPSLLDLVKIARYAENHYVGVPCGILDQGVSGYGKENALVHIDCHALAFDTKGIPEGTHFWIFNTGVKHSLVDSLYSKRHAECQEGFAAAKDIVPGIECLVQYPLDKMNELEAALDPVTFKRVRHVIEENDRVRGMLTLLKGESVDLKEAGAYLTASHRSSQHLFENSCEELDFLVDQLEGMDGVFGARLTGGGFGGAVMAWTSDAFGEADRQKVVDAYAARYDHAPRVIHCQTGDGAQLIK